MRKLIINTAAKITKAIVHGSRTVSAIVFPLVVLPQNEPVKGKTNLTFKLPPTVISDKISSFARMDVVHQLR